MRPKPVIVPRAPPASPELETLNHFVRTAGRELPPEESKKKAKPQPNRRLTVYLPKAMVKRLKMRCAQGDMQLSEAALEAFTTWLGKP